MEYITTCSNCHNRFSWDGPSPPSGMPDCPVCGFNNKTGKRATPVTKKKQKKFPADSDWLSRWRTFHFFAKVAVCVGCPLLYYTVWTASDIPFWGRTALGILIAAIGYVSLHLGPDFAQFSAIPGFLSSLAYLPAVYIPILTSKELSDVGVMGKIVLAALISSVAWWPIFKVCKMITDTVRSRIYRD